MTSRAEYGIAGKLAVVTGAGRGLGRCVALSLARRGAKIVAVARTRPQVDDTARVVVAEGGEAVALAADISRPEDVERLRQAVHRELGPVAILVNAAGVFGPIEFVVRSRTDEWIETLQINVVGPYLTCRAFAPDMMEAGWGRIINFSSAASLHPPGPLNSAYGVSKVALNQFTRHLAAELAGTGVTANAIHPGEVKTAMWGDIRERSQRLGNEAEAYRRWAATVGETGGDDPQKAADLVLRIIRDPDPGNTGKFLWIEGGQQTPIASW